MALPESLERLLLPESYPHPCDHITLIETHISWVILTGSFAYKLKKPVHFSFVDFSTLELRAHFCQEELRCNRAFARDLYLDVVPVVEADGRLAVGSPHASGAVLEWAVKMRQFDPDLGADRLLARGMLELAAIRRFGQLLAVRHDDLPQHHGSRDEVEERVFGPVEGNFSEIDRTGLASRHGNLLTDAAASARSLGERLRKQLDARMTGGWIRECHGDLHLSNLALIDGEITPFDCLEFNANLRWIDTMSDVAFLFMDCHFCGEVELAYGFLDGYLDRSGDYAGVILLHYFAAYRSMVRAKVAALRWAQDGGADDEQRSVAHMRWAVAWLTRRSGKLLLTCGLSGSGKSHLASALVPSLPAIRLRSDVTRKKLAGLDALAASESPVDGGLYAAEQSDAVHELLLTTALALVEAGEMVIVDATFIDRARRERFRAAAAGLGVPLVILHCRAPEPLLRERLAARATTGGDPSEATGAVLDLQLARYQPPTGEASVIEMDMTEPLTPSRVSELVKRVARV